MSLDVLTEGEGACMVASYCDAARLCRLLCIRRQRWPQATVIMDTGLQASRSVGQLCPQAKKTRQHSSLFLVACARGLLPDCQQLLEAGALLDSRDKEGLGAAHFAAAHGKADLLAYLWSKGVELDGEDPSDFSDAVISIPKVVSADAADVRKRSPTASLLST